MDKSLRPLGNPLLFDVRLKAVLNIFILSKYSRSDNEREKKDGGRGGCRHARHPRLVRGRRLPTSATDDEIFEIRKVSYQWRHSRDSLVE